MIRVNLIADAVPLAHHEPVRAAGLLRALVMVACLVGAVGWLVFDYTRTRTELTGVQQQIALQQAQLARLNRLRREVATFEQQKRAIDHRIQLITQLETNRTESQQLLGFLAQTVNGSPSLWLTGVKRKGNALDIEGRAASIDAVARFISQLHHSGHFGQIRMKTAQQQPNRDVPTFKFSLAADYQPGGAAGGKGAAAGAGE